MTKFTLITLFTLVTLITLITTLCGISVRPAYAGCSACNGPFENPGSPEPEKPSNHQYHSTFKHKASPHHHQHKPQVVKRSEIAIPGAPTVVTGAVPHEKIVVIEPIKKCKSCLEAQTICPPLPAQVWECQLINPADIVDFTCYEFPAKLKTCEPFVCQAPSAQDPTIKATWEIVGKENARCVVRTITENIGVKDLKGNAVPFIQTCEYDEIGIVGLNKRFLDMQKRVYHFSTAEHFNGIYNCTYKLDNRKVRKPPLQYQ